MSSFLLLKSYFTNLKYHTMFKIKIENYNESFVRITSNNASVYSLLAKNYTFVVPHGKFLKKKDKNGKKWDGTIKLFNFKTGLIYKGLVGDVKDLLLDSDAGDIDLVGFGKNPGIHNGFDIDYIKSLNIPDRYTPRAFAVEAAHQALKQTRATVESPTSSGKSMIIYYMVRRIIDSYLDEKRKVLIVVPSITLVDQMEGDFVDYGYKDDIWKIPGADVKHADIIVSTWQSLQNKPDEFFEDFDAVFVDEAHGATATEVKRVVECCINARYRYGFSGTFKDSEIDPLVLRGLFGRNIVAITIQELKEMKIIADTNIVMHRITYPSRLFEKVIHVGMEYASEIGIVTKSKQRDEIILNILESEENKNGIILFRFVNHMERVIEKFKKRFPNRPYRVIYGGVGRDERKDIRLEMDAVKDGDRNIVLFATFDTMSTGVSIKNLDFGVFGHPMKSKIKVLQALGRLLRISDTKFRATLHDVWDDFTTVSKKITENFGKSHAKARLLHYIDQGYTLTDETHEIE